MTDELTFLCIIGLLFILGCASIFSKPEKEDNNKTQKPPKNKTNSGSDIDALDRLLQQGVITQKEYNNFVVKIMNRK